MAAPFELQPSQSVNDIDELPQTHKEDIDTVERADMSTHVDKVSVRLTKDHRDYLIERHGTLDLDPVPGISPADPLNWPAWKVSVVNSAFSEVQTRTQENTLMIPENA